MKLDQSLKSKGLKRVSLNFFYLDITLGGLLTSSTVCTVEATVQLPFISKCRGWYDSSFDVGAALSTNLATLFANVTMYQKNNEHIHLVPILNGSEVSRPSHREDNNVQIHTQNKLTSPNTVHILTSTLYGHCAGCPNASETNVF